MLILVLMLAVIHVLLRTIAYYCHVFTWLSLQARMYKAPKQDNTDKGRGHQQGVGGGQVQQRHHGSAPAHTGCVNLERSLYHFQCLDFLQTKTPIPYAGSIRSLACMALLGLARSSLAAKVMSKLAIFNNNTLNQQDPRTVAALDGEDEGLV